MLTTISTFPSEGRDTEVATEQAVHEIRAAKLEEKTKREVVLNCIYTKSHHYALLQQSMAPCLNKYAWKDLHLFYGTTSAPAYHLMSRINRTVTT